jgi:hypothetical protein
MFAEVPPLVIDVGVVSGVFVSVGTAGALLYRGFKAAVRDIVNEAVAPINEQLRPNGGHSLRDRVDRIERKVDQLRRPNR